MTRPVGAWRRSIRLGTRTDQRVRRGGPGGGGRESLGYRHDGLRRGGQRWRPSILWRDSRACTTRLVRWWPRMDPLGDRTTLTYDAVGRRTASTNPLGEISTAVYDAAGRTAAVVDPLGLRTSFTYDAAGADRPDQRAGSDQHECVRRGWPKTSPWRIRWASGSPASTTPPGGPWRSRTRWATDTRPSMTRPGGPWRSSTRWVSARR